MFKKILVPVDLTDRNSRALDVAAYLAKREQGTVTLLHVIETLDAPYDELEDFYRGLETTARRELHQLASPLRDAQVAFEERVHYGKRAPEVVGYADGNGFDLVVVSSHRITPENISQGLFTISHQIAIAATTPVLIVK